MPDEAIPDYGDFPLAAKEIASSWKEHPALAMTHHFLFYQATLQRLALAYRQQPPYISTNSMI